MADMPQLATALPVTVGETSRTLPVVRVALTQKLHLLDLGRATAQLTYALPSGGRRTMPLCQPCHTAETTETTNA